MIVSHHTAQALRRRAPFGATRQSRVGNTRVFFAILICYLFTSNLAWGACISAHLLSPLRRFIRRFRNGAPGGRGRSFEPGHFQPVYIPLQDVICFFRHPKLASLSVCLAVSPSFHTSKGEIRGFHVPCIRPHRRVRSTLSTG